MCVCFSDVYVIFFSSQIQYKLQNIKSVKCEVKTIMDRKVNFVPFLLLHVYVYDVYAYACLLVCTGAHVCVCMGTLRLASKAFLNSFLPYSLRQGPRAHQYGIAN